jgi:hypothetical protein
MTANEYVPNFLIIGVQKGGTTSLFNYLQIHPDIKLPKIKEIHYFDFQYENGNEWYQQLFPKICDNKITGEASPFYIFSKKALERIYDYNKNIKLIILLRNPIERAFSHYNMNVSTGIEKLTFEEAIIMENQRIYNSDFIKQEDEFLKPYSDLRNFSYIKRGIYHEQIKNVLDLFPAENIMILKSENLYSHTALILNDVFRFLGLKYLELDDVKFEVHNGASDKHELNASTKLLLKNIFEPHNIELENMINMKFNWN